MTNELIRTVRGRVDAAQSNEEAVYFPVAGVTRVYISNGFIFSRCGNEEDFPEWLR